MPWSEAELCLKWINRTNRVKTSFKMLELHAIGKKCRSVENYTVINATLSEEESKNFAEESESSEEKSVLNFSIRLSRYQISHVTLINETNIQIIT